MTREHSAKTRPSAQSPTLKHAAAKAGARSITVGAIFLMATSAIGSGFLTQTAVFTKQLGAAFAFAILISTLIDIAVQMNVWRVIGVSGMRAQELAHRVIPGSGWVLSALIVTGGVVFNISNLAGAGLGLNAMFGLDPKIGGLASGAVALLVFLSKRAGMALDRILVALGTIMIVLAIYVAVSSRPPVGDALKNAVLPESVDWLVITTLVGGTVGGFITYAGAHRLLDSGQTGPEHAKTTANASATAIIVTSVMRVLLFLAALGVVAGGAMINVDGNPMADVFKAAVGGVGMQVFGLVLWAASLSSLIGCSYTSATFLMPSDPTKRRAQNYVTVGLLLFSGVLFALLGTAPANLLLFAGAFNGLVLPIGFTIIMFIATFRTKSLLGGYRYPRWLLACGIPVALLTWFLAWQSFGGVFDLLS
jgi:Mn2+/Fe2+ NRAMP family transporter